MTPIPLCRALLKAVIQTFLSGGGSMYVQIIRDGLGFL
jgi:hypothetical protein